MSSHPIQNKEATNLLSNLPNHQGFEAEEKLHADEANYVTYLHLSVARQTRW